MFVAAYDELFNKLDKSLLSRIVAISASGQQHGSVYWKTGAGEILENLNSSRSLQEQLKSAFSKQNSPIWMDSSTTEICKALQSAVGGPDSLTNETGSTAYERFTVHQIIKFGEENTDDWKSTERISLISSFAISLLIGKFASIDYSDGSGRELNLYFFLL
jgi:xylulokinase